MFSSLLVYNNTHTIGNIIRITGSIHFEMDLFKQLYTIYLLILYQITILNANF